ncbi:hypothetical protein HYV84_00235 [Candidatus Woesearchaeota archaeon]|nr:hypothetical protein [Candidatus Woesearchaeota archaeon]
MADKERLQQIDRWAAYCKAEPEKAKKAVNGLVDAQIDIANRFYQRLRKTPEGRKTYEKLLKLRMERSGKGK